MYIYIFIQNVIASKPLVHKLTNSIQMNDVLSVYPLKKSYPTFLFLKSKASLGLTSSQWQRYGIELLWSRGTEILEKSQMSISQSNKVY